MKDQHLIPLPSNGRIVIYDSLRSAMVFFVIVLHVCMTYMLFPVQWWQFVSKEQSAIFTTIVQLIDVFVIPILFFISGYFTPSSYLKKGIRVFLKEKCMHILLPWIIGILFILPLTPLFLGTPLDSLFDLIEKNPLYFFHNQSHMWYLMVLFLFFSLYALYAYFIGPINQYKPNTYKKPILLLIALIIISAIFSYLGDKYITPFSNWINIVQVIRIKPSKIAMHICMFILGICAWQQNWLKEGGWMPNIRVWRILAIVSLPLYMVLKAYLPFYYPILRTINVLFDSVCAFSALIYAILIALKLQNTRLSNFLIQIEPASYGIYWIHIPLMFGYLYQIEDLNVPIWIKSASGIIVTSIASWLISNYILKKIPFLKNIF